MNTVFWERGGRGGRWLCKPVIQESRVLVQSVVCSGTKSTLVKVMTFISWAPLQLRLEKATFPSRT